MRSISAGPAVLAEFHRAARRPRRVATGHSRTIVSAIGKSRRFHPMNTVAPPPSPRRPAHLRCVAAAWSLAALAGCMVGPDYAPPASTVAPQFTETQPPATTRPVSTVSADDVQVTEWWTTFGDAELDQLVARAAKGNLNLAIAASRVRQARAQRGITGASLFPNLSVAPGYQRSRGSKNISLGSLGGGGSSGSSKSAADRPADVAQPINNPKAGGPQSPLGSGGLPNVNEDLYEVGFDSTWEVDVFGGQRRQVESAIDLIQSAQEDQRDMLVSTEAEVARNYVQLRGLQLQLAIAKKNLAAQQDILDLTTSRYHAGFVTDLDVARQATQVSTTAAALPALDAQIRVTIHAIGILLGEDPNALTKELLTDGPIPPVPPRIPIGMPSELLRRRPDIRRAERQLASATANIGVAVADLYPKFSITAAFGFDTNKPKYLVDWNSKYWALSPGVSWPIFDAGRIHFNIDAQKEGAAQALDTYQLTVLQALRDVEDALDQYRTEQLRNQSLADAARTAGQARDLAQQQYEQGITDYTTVLTAEQDEFGAEDSLAQSTRAISTDLVALYKALGGGWQVMLPENQQAPPQKFHMQ
jgi:multidrug efflux system outer membrane protein